MPALKMISASASAPMYQRVSRVRTVSSTAFLHARNDHIALAAQRADQFQFVAVIYLAPQPLHVNLDQIGKRVEVYIPYMLADLGPADDFARAPREVFQQRVLFAGQLDPTAGALDLMRAHIDCQVGDFDFLRAQRLATPQERPRPRQQFMKIKWLCQVIV